jgi:hypothetical protein
MTAADLDAVYRLRLADTEARRAAESLRGASGREAERQRALMLASDAEDLIERLRARVEIAT